MLDQVLQQIKACYHVSEHSWTAIYSNIDLCRHPHYEDIVEAMQSIRVQQQHLLQYTSQLYEININMMMKIIRLKEELQQADKRRKEDLQVLQNRLSSALYAIEHADCTLQQYSQHRTLQTFWKHLLLPPRNNTDHTKHVVSREERWQAVHGWEDDCAQALAHLSVFCIHSIRNIVTTENNIPDASVYLETLIHEVRKLGEKAGFLSSQLQGPAASPAEPPRTAAAKQSTPESPEKALNKSKLTHMSIHDVSNEEKDQLLMLVEDLRMQKRIETEKWLHTQKKVYEMEATVHAKDHELQSLRSHVASLRRLLQDQQQQQQPSKSFVRLHQNAFQSKSKVESPARVQPVDREVKGSGHTSSSSGSYSSTSSSSDSLDFSKISPIRRQSLLMGEESLQHIPTNHNHHRGPTTSTCNGRDDHPSSAPHPPQTTATWTTPVKAPAREKHADSFLYSPEADSHFVVDSANSTLSNSSLLGTQVSTLLPSKTRFLAQHGHDQHHHQNLSSEYKALDTYISAIEPTLFELANTSL